MANGDLTQLQQQATQAGQKVADLTASTPNLLQSLKSNLTNIFAKDNPVIEARGQALADFLSTPARARAEFLPVNLPTVEGSPLNLSPTQQSAITTSRRAAALAPLAGLNQIVTGIYGNIPQLVSGAGDIYRSQIEAAGVRANLAQQAFENAFAQAQEAERIRQFNETQSRLRAEASQSNAFQAALNAILSRNVPQTTSQEFIGPTKPPLSFFEEPDVPELIPGVPDPAGEFFSRGGLKGRADVGLENLNLPLRAGGGGTTSGLSLAGTAQPSNLLNSLSRLNLGISPTGMLTF